MHQIESSSCYLKPLLQRDVAYKIRRYIVCLLETYDLNRCILASPKYTLALIPDLFFEFSLERIWTFERDFFWFAELIHAFAEWQSDHIASLRMSLLRVTFLMKCDLHSHSALDFSVLFAISSIVQNFEICRFNSLIRACMWPLRQAFARHDPSESRHL